MGLYRFVLSALVVLFHTGSISTPAGYSAVFGFYLLSGYLIPLAIERNYGLSRHGVTRYYGNRVLRILPLYAFFLILTAALLSWHGSATFQFSEKTVHILPDTSGYGLVEIGHELLFNAFIGVSNTGAVYVLNGFPKLVPQAWSLVVEFTFYALAPLLLILARSGNLRRHVPVYGLLLLSLGFALYSGHIGLDFQTYRYRSTFGSFYIFMLGFFAYLYRDRIPVPFIPRITPTILLLAYLIFVIFVNNGTLVESQIYWALSLQFVITVAGMAHSNPPSRLDRRLGHLSYGIFVGHFCVALLMSIVSADHTHFELLKGSFGAFGSLSFGIWCLMFTILAAYFAHKYIENWIDRLRDKVRGHVVQYGGA